MQIIWSVEERSLIPMILPETMKAKIFSEIGTVPTGLGKHKWLTDAVEIRIN
jgi:hypothetical protein